MTKSEIKSVATTIFKMRVNRYERPSPSEINTRRKVVRKAIEDRRYSSLLAALARDELATG